jgi:thiopeptide-type bacteriocin biosynthesis protein
VIDTSRWLYYKIYPGAAAGKLDHLITGPLQQIARLDGIIRWFFLRYTDEGGPHVRLRLKTEADVASLHGVVDPILKRALAELPLLPPSSYRPVILPPLPSNGPAANPSDRYPAPHIARATYEPDIETFGEEGVEIAETLFCASSDAVVRILNEEREHKFSRKTAVPLFMAAIADAFMPEAEPSIWRNYASYWLDGSEARASAQQWTQRFVAKATELRAQGVPVLAPDHLLSPGAALAVQTWRAASAVAADGFGTVADSPPRRPYELMFHFVHLMNNRLGLMPIEEAYFATLIAESLSVPSLT